MRAALLAVIVLLAFLAAYSWKNSPAPEPAAFDLHAFAAKIQTPQDFVFDGYAITIAWQCSYGHRAYSSKSCGLAYDGSQRFAITADGSFQIPAMQRQLDQQQARQMPDAHFYVTAEVTGPQGQTNTYRKVYSHGYPQGFYEELGDLRVMRFSAAEIPITMRALRGEQRIPVPNLEQWFPQEAEAEHVVHITIWHQWGHGNVLNYLSRDVVVPANGPTRIPEMVFISHELSDAQKAHDSDVPTDITVELNAMARVSLPNIYSGVAGERLVFETESTRRSEGIADSEDIDWPTELLKPWDLELDISSYGF